MTKKCEIKNSEWDAEPVRLMNRSEYEKVWVMASVNEAQNRSQLSNDLRVWNLKVVNFKFIPNFFCPHQVNQSFSYESLRVLNHTECQCIYKFQHRPHHTVASSHPTQRSHTVRCRCPLDFTVTTTRHGRSCECRCDNVECRMRYEGKEKFSISDRSWVEFELWKKFWWLFWGFFSCINGGTCTKPNCLAGAYDSSHGRCPPRNDRLKRHSTAQHHFISW